MVGNEIVRERDTGMVIRGLFNGENDVGMDRSRIRWSQRSRFSTAITPLQHILYRPIV